MTNRVSTITTTTTAFRDMPVAYHGLAAFRGGKSGFSVVKKAVALETTAGTICVADRPIGKVGVMVQGDVRFLFNADCWSTAAERDSDEYDASYTGYRTIGSNNAEFLETLAIARNGFGAGKYVEGWMRDPTIVGVWIDSTAPAYQKKAARVIARRNHLFVRELDANELLGETK